jgi:hypothetical protein
LGGTVAAGTSLTSFIKSVSITASNANGTSNSLTALLQ